MDGGSDDETRQVLEQFTPAVRWVSERDEGQTDALNKGINASDGEIIGWLNSDDVYYQGCIERVLAVFRDHPEVDVVYGKAHHIDEGDRAFEEYPTQAWDFERLKESCFICQPALFFRRSVVQRHGLPDASLNYCMDYEYWLRIAAGGARFFYLEEELAGSRMYGENKTLGARIAVHREINDMLRRRFGVVPDRWIFNYAHAVVEPRIDRNAAPRLFLLALLLCSALASIRWNRGIGPVMRRVMAQWARGLLAPGAAASRGTR